jgi:hypothetical protein
MAGRFVPGHRWAVLPHLPHRNDLSDGRPVPFSGHCQGERDVPNTPVAIGQSHLPPATGARNESPAAQLIRRILQASQDLDPIELQAQLDRAASLWGTARCIDEILVPATRRLRRMIATGQRDVVQGLMATEAIRAWLNRRASFAPPPQEIGPILMACGPRDLDMVGPESLALLLRFQHWPCRVLGPRTSTFTLTIAALAADAMAAVVFSTEGRGRPQAVVSLRAVDALGIPVFYGGNAFHLQCSRRQLPGRYLGTGIQRACTLLISTLAPADPRRPVAPRIFVSKHGSGPLPAPIRRRRRPG